MIAVTNATDGPAMIVTGVSRTASTVIEVLAAMLTPSGAFSIDVHSGLSPCVTAWLTYPRSHSKNTWSARLCVSSVEFGAAHSRAVTTPAASRNPSATSTSVRRDFLAVGADGSPGRRVGDGQPGRRGGRRRGRIHHVGRGGVRARALGSDVHHVADRIG